MQADLRTLAFLGPELLSAPPDIAGDNRVGGAENRVGRTVVLLQLDHFYFREVFLHVEQV